MMCIRLTMQAVFRCVSVWLTVMCAVLGSLDVGLRNGFVRSWWPVVMQAVLDPNNIVPVAVCCFIGAMMILLQWRVIVASNREQLARLRRSQYAKLGSFDVPLSLCTPPPDVRREGGEDAVGLLSDVVCITTQSLVGDAYDRVDNEATNRGMVGPLSGPTTQKAEASTRRRSSQVAPSVSVPHDFIPVGRGRFQGLTQWVSRKLVTTAPTIVNVVPTACGTRGTSDVLSAERRRSVVERRRATMVRQSTSVFASAVVAMDRQKLSGHTGIPRQLFRQVYVVFVEMIRRHHVFFAVFQARGDAALLLTRPQRVVVLACLLFTSMCVTAMLLGRRPAQVEARIVAGLVSAACMVPCRVLLPKLYRSANAPPVLGGEEDASGGGGRRRGVRSGDRQKLGRATSTVMSVDQRVKVNGQGSGDGAGASSVSRGGSVASVKVTPAGPSSTVTPAAGIGEAEITSSGWLMTIIRWNLSCRATSFFRPDLAFCVLFYRLQVRCRLPGELL